MEKFQVIKKRIIISRTLVSCPVKWKWPGHNNKLKPSTQRSYYLLLLLKGKRTIRERYIWILLQSQHSSLYFLLSLRVSLSKSLKLSGFVERLCQSQCFMSCELQERIFYLQCFLQLWHHNIFPHSLFHHIVAVSGDWMSDTTYTFLQIVYELVLCLSPGSYWSLDIRKYGTLLMEPASRPLLPAL